MGDRVKPKGPLEEPSDSKAPTGKESYPAHGEDLWQEVFSRRNLARALKQVERNRGAPGPDAMTTQELRPWLHDHWPEVRQALGRGTYKPKPVRRVTIEKPAGGTRDLGVPNVLDRMISQAIAQILTKIFDETFSDRSYGFRPGRSAHQAVMTAKGYVEDGYGWAIQVDLDSFFDRVQHDALMVRVAKRVRDKRLLRLIGSYLRAGIMVGGITQATTEGTPQGSPLSPVLSNIMLDDLDKELERRGLRFVRYCDDITIYVTSERATGRVMGSTAKFIERRLKLRVNRRKSVTGRATKLTLLGFGFFQRGGEVKVRIDPKARKRAKERIRRLTSRRWRISMKDRIRALNRYTAGWVAYYRLVEMPRPFEDLDKRLRRRLRQVRWKEWKRPLTRRRRLIALGIPRQSANRWSNTRKGYWRIAGSPPLQRALPNGYWQDLGLRGFSEPYERLRVKL